MNLTYHIEFKDFGWHETARFDNEEAAMADFRSRVERDSKSSYRVTVSGVLAEHNAHINHTMIIEGGLGLGLVKFEDDGDDE